MADKILLVAVGTGDLRSNPFMVYTTKQGKPPARLSLLLEDRTTSEGVAETRLSNVECGLIKSNTPAYSEGLFKGFRRTGPDGRTFVVVEAFVDNAPKAEALMSSEPF